MKFMMTFQVTLERRHISGGVSTALAGFPSFAAVESPPEHSLQLHAMTIVQATEHAAGHARPTRRAKTLELLDDELLLDAIGQ